MPLDRSAPLLCAGVTVYSPMKNLHMQVGQRLGVAGIGGLGHMAIKIASALGIEVIALTNTPWKVQDAKRLGAKDAILVKDTNKMKKFEGSFDYIIDTIPFSHDTTPYLKLLKINSKAQICILGAVLPMLIDYELVIRNGLTLTSSIIGGLADSQEFLDLCQSYNILPDVTVIKAKDIMSTHNQLMTSQAKYRYVIDNSTI